MVTNTSPTPIQARTKSGLTRRELSELVPCALSTVYDVERAKDWPRQRAMRNSYLAALGLREVEGQIKAIPKRGRPVTKKPAVKS